MLVMSRGVKMVGNISLSHIMPLELQNITRTLHSITSEQWKYLNRECLGRLKISLPLVVVWTKNWAMGMVVDLGFENCQRDLCFASWHGVTEFFRTTIEINVSVCDYLMIMPQHLGDSLNCFLINHNKPGALFKIHEHAFTRYYRACTVAWYA